MQTIDFDTYVNHVSRSARFLVNDHSAFAENGVQERGLADVRPSYDRNFHSGLFLCRDLGRIRNVIQNPVDQALHAEVVFSADRDRLLDSQFVEFKSVVILDCGVNLVKHEEERFSVSPQMCSQFAVCRH